MPLFSIALNHTLMALGARSSVIMVHTSYNRNRGEDDFNRVLSLIESGMDLIRLHSLNNNINWRYICTNEEYELIGLLKEVEYETKDGDFKTYFLFDYNKEWYGTSDGFMALSELPDITVHVRHTKLNFSGGWIPGKMKRSISSTLKMDLYTATGSMMRSLLWWQLQYLPNFSMKEKA